MPGFDLLDTTTTWSMPAPSASSMTICSSGVSPIGSSSLGTALVAGRNRVPHPAAGTTAQRTVMSADLIDGTRRYRPDSDADVRVQVRQDGRDDRGAAVDHRQDADVGRPPTIRPQ